jgi:hypothetical protein
MDDWVARLPVNARSSYKQAHAAADAKGDMMGMRSWLSIWRRYLADPTRALVELDMAKMLLQNKGENRNEAMAKAAKRANLTEAKMLTRGVRTRTNNPELLELVDKADEEIDRDMSQTK